MNVAHSLISMAIITVVLIAVGARAEDVPAKLTPPSGSIPVGAYTAAGVQIYACTANGWTFKAPEANLADAEGKIFAKHHAGPTWEATDGSKATGKVRETAPSPVTGAIPWLLLSAEPSGAGALSAVKFVQRINTTGGIGPTGPCPTPGAEQRVPYTAEYVMYR
jgi:hypothetical protein